MKNRIKLTIISITLGLSLISGCAENNSNFVNEANLASTEIKVWGNCEMCQETIEGALETKGIAKASWNPESKILSVSYDSTIIGLDDIHKRVSESGYDTEKYKASDESYYKLHECCQYERRP